MRCQGAYRLLGRKESRGLDPREERLLSDHLNVCPECRDIEDQLERTWHALSGHPQIEPSEDFLARVRFRIRAETPSREVRQNRWAHLRWQWVALAAGIVLAAILLTKAVPISSRPPASEPGASIGTDRGDELLLDEIERILQRSETDYLAAYDSWPGALPETGKTGPENKVPSEGTVRRKIS
jgi:hypothetical protein